MNCKYEGGAIRWMMLVFIAVTCVCNSCRLARMEAFMRDRLQEVRVELEVSRCAE